jgi:hypothetical protein
MIWNENMKSVNFPNFFIDIPFESDNTHVEDFAREWNDIA